MVQQASRRERAPRRAGTRTALTVPGPVLAAAQELADELGTTPNDALIRLAEEGALARRRRHEAAALAAERRAAVAGAELGDDAPPLPPAEAVRAAMLSGRGADL